MIFCLVFSRDKEEVVRKRSEDEQEENCRELEGGEKIETREVQLVPARCVNTLIRDRFPNEISRMKEFACFGWFCRD